MQTTENVIKVMHSLGEKQMPITRAYRQMYNENLYISAYSRLYANEGALTPGVTDETVDGMNMSKIKQIIAELKTETYRWKPVRRSYVQRKDGRKRPLGLPTWKDKLVEEVIRIMLQAYYEPQFSDNSHGFRPERGCHTALQQITQNWTGTVWFIEGDIRGCFDNINHERLMEILSKKVHDQRLLRLIRHRLESGIMEDWQYTKTYSGAPQGSVLSPLLANIYLHELDEHIETYLMPRWNKGKRRKHNSEYVKYRSRRSRARAKGDYVKYKEATKAMRKLPSQDMHDPYFRRLKYVRYADDFLLGFIGNKREAKWVLQNIEEFLGNQLMFQTSKSKSKITHAKSETANFLGYGISVYGNISTKITGLRRSANGRITLKLPEGYVAAKSQEWERNGKPLIDGNALAYSVEEAIASYAIKYRGIANYYQYAVDVHELGRLKYAMERSLVHTLSAKLKISVKKIYQKYGAKTLVNGQPYKVLRSQIVNEETGKVFTATWGGVPLKRKRMVDEPLQDTVQHGYQGRNELVSRFMANKCELCGKEGCELEGHHINKVSKLRSKKYANRNLKLWESMMVARNRKTLFVCKACHVQIHTQK